MAVTPKLSVLPERQDPLWLCETIASELERLSELRELLSIAEEYCYWGEKADLKQSLKRVAILVEHFNLSFEGGLDELQGSVANLRAVIHHEGLSAPSGGV